MGIVYCYTNKITGKKYVGQTIHPEQRKRSHLHEAIKRNSDHYFHRSIRKHGWENFDYEILEETDNLSEREAYFIKTLNTHWPHGYNEIPEHNQMTDEVRQKISETKKKQWNLLSEDEKQKRLDVLSRANKGKKHSEDTRRKMSESAKAFLAANPRSKRVWTQEMKDKQSQRLKEKYAAGIGRWTNK